MTDRAESKGGIGFGTIVGGGAALLALIFCCAEHGFWDRSVPVLGLHDGYLGDGDYDRRRSRLS